MTPDEIKMEIHRVDDATIVRPIGDIDLGRAPSFRAQLAAAHVNRPRRLIVDLADVPYMDSSGIATLLETMRNVHLAGGRLILCALQEKVRSVFEIARLQTVFTIVSSPEEAMRT